MDPSLRPETFTVPGLATVIFIPNQLNRYLLEIYLDEGFNGNVGAVNAASYLDASWEAGKLYFQGDEHECVDNDTLTRFTELCQLLSLTSEGDLDELCRRLESSLFGMGVNADDDLDSDPKPANRRDNVPGGYHCL